MQQESLVEYGSRRVIITLTAIVCALLEIVDTTIVNVALPDMKGNLGATTSEIGWVVTAYAIGNVIIVPMTSWLSQQFGRRNYFAASILLFTLCSFLCGNATGIWELVVFRFFAGSWRRGSPGYIADADYGKLSSREKRNGSGDLRFGCHRWPDTGPPAGRIYHV